MKIKKILVLVIFQLIIYNYGFSQTFFSNNVHTKSKVSDLNIKQKKTSICDTLVVNVNLGTLNSDSQRIHFFGSVKLNSTDDVLQSMSSNQSVLMFANISPKRPKKIGFDLLVGINVLSIRPPFINSDSFDAVSMLFPDAGNQGLIISPQFNWVVFNNYHSFQSSASFAFRQFNFTKQITDSSQTRFTFAALNLNLIPINYVFNYQKNDIAVNVALMPYVNFFNIPNEDALEINKLFDSKNILFNTTAGSNIWSLGLKTQVKVNDLFIYADLRQNLTDSSLPDSHPFKGFVFNTGVGLDLNVFSK
jgi:hypothetical protein